MVTKGLFLHALVEGSAPPSQSSNSALAWEGVGNCWGEGVDSSFLALSQSLSRATEWAVLGHQH